LGASEGRVERWGACWAVVVWVLRGGPGGWDGDRGSWCRLGEGKCCEGGERWRCRRGESEGHRRGELMWWGERKVGRGCGVVCGRRCMDGGRVTAMREQRCVSGGVGSGEIGGRWWR
jgi:hypothetical protein